MTQPSNRQKYLIWHASTFFTAGVWGTSPVSSSPFLSHRREYRLWPQISTGLSSSSSSTLNSSLMFPRLKLESGEWPSSPVMSSCRFRPTATKIVIEIRAKEIQGKSRIRERVWLLFLGLLRYIREKGSLHVELVEEIRNKPSRARPTTHIWSKWVECGL